MKSRLTALLLTLALLLTALPVCAAAEETSSTRMPLYDVFPLQLDDNTVLELPIDWGYQFVELEGVPPIAYAMNDSEQLLMMVKIPADYTPNEVSDRLGLTSFIPEGTAVMLGIRHWKLGSRCACSSGRTSGSIPRRISTARRKTAK